LDCKQYIALDFVVTSPKHTLINTDAFCRVEVDDDAMVMIVYSVVLIGLAYIDDGTKIGISISEVDVPCSKEQPCLMTLL
jgi:hypothetical protein